MNIVKKRISQKIVLMAFLDVLDSPYMVCKSTYPSDYPKHSFEGLIVDVEALRMEGIKKGLSIKVVLYAYSHFENDHFNQSDFGKFISLHFF